jgi:hypothetical protein
MSRQTDLFIAGTTRSGNTFLEVVLSSMYKNKNIISKHDHTVVYLLNRIDNENIITPLRNPLDSIASHYTFKNFLGRNQIDQSIDMDIKYYTRYYKFINDNFNKILVLDFDIFTKNLSYISDSIKEKFNIEKTDEVDLDLISQYMERNRSLFFNKRDEAIVTQEVKDMVSSSIEFKNVVIEYNNIKSKMEA